MDDMKISHSDCKLHTYYNFCIDIKDQELALLWLIKNISPTTKCNQYYSSGNNWYAKSLNRITSLIGFSFVEKRVPLHYNVTIIDEHDLAIAFKLTFDEVSIGTVD